jgi:outer membrane protein
MEESVLRKLTLTLILLVAFLAITPVFAQLKIGYVNSQKIMAEYQEAIDAKKKLEKVQGEYQVEYDNMVREYTQMADEIDSQSLLLSEEKKQEKLRLLQDKAAQIERYKFEKLSPEGGELYRKNQEIFQPVIEKINLVIQKIGRVEEYDFIFDATSGVLVHALPKYDITEQVLEELNRGVSSQKNTNTN